MSYEILFPKDIARRAREFLVHRGYRVRVGDGFDEGALIRDAADCDAILTNGGSFTRRVMDAAKKLKVIARCGVGAGAVDLDAATELGIQITHTPIANSNSVAEHALAMLLACAKNLVRADAETRKNRWQEMRAMTHPIEVSGKALGIIGFGNIGRLMARKAAEGLDMEILIYDPYVEETQIPDGVVREEDVHQLLAASDFVSIHVPATAATKGMINKTLLGEMRRTAFLINCANSDIVSQADLLTALTEGWIAGAALDVLGEEPPPPDNPFLRLDNVILTPHIGSSTPEAMEAMGLHAAKSIDEVLSGDFPTWPVNRI